MGLESVRLWDKPIHPAVPGRGGLACICFVAKRTVVVIRLAIIGHRIDQRTQRDFHEPRFVQRQAQRPAQSQPSNYVLMLVVRKLNHELPRVIRIAKTEASLVTRRSFRMAVAADYRLRAFEKLLAMAAHASIVIRKVGDVGKAVHLCPVCGGNFVASRACFLMLPGGVRKCRVIDLALCARLWPGNLPRLSSLSGRPAGRRETLRRSRECCGRQ